MFLSGLKYLRRLERQVKFAKNRCCKIKPVAVKTKGAIDGRDMAQSLLLLEPDCLYYCLYYIAVDMSMTCWEEIRRSHFHEFPKLMG